MQLPPRPGQAGTIFLAGDAAHRWLSGLANAVKAVWGT